MTYVTRATPDQSDVELGPAVRWHVPVTADKEAFVTKQKPRRSKRLTQNPQTSMKQPAPQAIHDDEGRLDFRHRHSQFRVTRGHELTCLCGYHMSRSRVACMSRLEEVYTGRAIVCGGGTGRWLYARVTRSGDGRVRRARRGLRDTGTMRGQVARGNYEEAQLHVFGER